MTSTLATQPKAAAQTRKILVVGSGFAGFWAALAARRFAGNQVDVTLLSPEPVLQIRPRLYEARPETLGVDLLPLLAKVAVTFTRGEAVGLDPEDKSVTLAEGSRLSYDRLIVATGSRMRRPPVPGATAAFSVDSQAEAIAFDRRLSEIARDVAAPTIAVVGAGFTGIELALELRDRLLAHGGEAAAERACIVLIDRADVVGPELGPGPRPVIVAALGQARVELRLAATVRDLAADHVSFADDSVLAADAVVLATGMAAAPFVAHVPGERDRLGRIIVDASLRAPAAPDIFVAGDAAAADTGDGHLALQSCQHAGQLGRVAGENAARDLLSEAPLPYKQLRYLTCLYLGRAGAVVTQGWDRRVDKTGAEAKALKRFINTQLIYPPAEGSAEALLAASSIDISDRAGDLDIGKAAGGPAGRAA
ncbi:MAG TPA: FAD-dependent oxidoreductase [Nordella sp.]|nr:FAD-dependent oxidoreductase [Nordella sp.]